MSGYTYGGESGATYGGPDGGTYGSETTPGEDDTPGFSYGGVNGATYGGPDGGTWNNRLPWFMGRRPIQRLVSLDVDYQSVELVYRVSQEEVKDWRGAYTTAGDIEVREQAGGRFRAASRAGTDPVVSLTVPIGYDHVIREGRYLVAGYEDENVGSGKLYDVTLTLQLLEQREPESESNVLLQTDGAWVLDFEYGTIALQPEQFRPPEGSSDTTPMLDFNVRLSDDQAAVLFNSASRQDAVSQREVPDGDNYWRDAAGGRNTVTLTTPEGSEIDGGDYVVTGWSAESPKRDDWDVELELSVEGSPHD